VSAISYPELVTDRFKFESALLEFEEIFEPAKRLPDQVFRRRECKYFAFEFGQVYSNQFPVVLKTLGERFKDNSILFMSIEPHAVDFYWERLGFYGMAIFEPETLERRLFPVMSRGGNPNSFRTIGGNVGAFWGSSLSWGIFCDRVSWELCVLALPIGSGASDLDLLKPKDWAALSSYMRGLYHWNPSIAEGFLSSFHKSYLAR
jgi:hypothetical protein